MDEKEMNLYDGWGIIRKNLRFIIYLFTISVFLSLIVSLLIPTTYRATASILPPQGGGTGGTLEGLMAAAGIQKATTSNILVAILKSKTMADEISKKFNFSQTHKRKPSRMDVKSSTEGVINVSVIDINPQVAADMANFYVSTLDRLNQTLAITSAGQTRRFIEERLKDAEKSLKNAEEKSESYQVAHKVLTGGQEGAAISSGELQGKLIAARIELKTKEKYLTGENPEIINLKNTVTETEKTIASLPPLETEIERLTRELVTQKTVYTILVRQYEQVKIDEARDTPTVQILDRASVPKRAYKPNIPKNMVLSGLIALFLGAFLSFLKEGVSSIKKPQE